MLDYGHVYIVLLWVVARLKLFWQNLGKKIMQYMTLKEVIRRPKMFCQVSSSVGTADGLGLYFLFDFSKI